jgi:two-component sensor histidine kinase
VLQLSGERRAIDLGAVLTELCASLQAMTGDTRTITIEGAEETIETPVWFTQPLVLAVTELVTNALRHAFVEGRDAAVHVVLQRLDGELKIVVSDNGRGLPPGYADGAGYGMKLMRAMVQQIGGGFTAESDGGARFTITAPFKID